MTPAEPVRRTGIRGLALSVGAYLIWGVIPIYFLLLAPAGPFEIVGWRVVFSLLVCALLLTVARSWGRFRALLRRRRDLGILALAGVLIWGNWQLYVFATLSGRVVDAALGYFINPIVTVLIGVVLLHERLRVAQWIAVGLSTVAVAVVAAGGSFLWIPIALLFGLYGYCKNRLGGEVDAIVGLAGETAALLLVAVVQLVLVGTIGGGLVFGARPGTTALLVGVGAVTAVPLLLFAGAVRRLPLTVVGLTQYLAPVLQFLTGVVLLHEAMSPARWAGFAIVWFALIVLSADGIAAARAGRADRARTVAGGPIEPA